MPEAAAVRALDWFVVAARLTRDGKHGREFQRHIAEVQREAHALGRAEALAAVRAAVETWRMAYDWKHDDRSFIDGWNAALDAAIDNLETPA